MSPAAELPVIAIVGDRAGPVFVAAAGVHGDEDEGPRALWQVAADLQPTRRRAIWHSSCVWGQRWSSISTAGGAVPISPRRRIPVWPEDKPAPTARRPFW